MCDSFEYQMNFSFNKIKYYEKEFRSNKNKLISNSINTIQAVMNDLVENVKGVNYWIEKQSLGI